MASPDPSDKEEYAFWQRKKAAADISKELGMTAEQTHDYMAMLEAH